MKNQKFNYVDGFLIPLPQKNQSKYLALAKLAAKVWMEHGALSYVECLAEDVPNGKVTSFPMAVKLKKGEKVVFSWVTYKSRKHRDQVMKKVMSDPRLAHLSEGDMPFDGMRMMWGGFKPIVRL
jgi:uncharacterized protein YbaA (DUF1428 family)